MSLAPAAGRVRPAAPRRRPGRSFSRRTRVIVTFVNLLLFAAIWETAVIVLDIKPIILPRLSVVIAEIPEVYREGVLIESLWVTLRVYLMGLGLALLVSIPLGLVLGGIKILDRIVSPYLWVIYTSPLIIFMPLILLWVGINNTARVVLVFISAVPAIVVVVMEGVKTVDISILRAARSFGAGRTTLFAKVVFPATIPFIATGVKMGVTRGLIGLFVGELFTSTNGIGYIIELSSKTFNMARVFAMLLIFVLFSVSMVGLAQYAERRLSAWRTSSV